MRTLSIHSNPIHIALLCGGQSSRFGSDKGLFYPREGNESVIGKAVRRFLSHSAHLWIIVRDQQQELRYQQALSRESLWPNDKISIVTDEEVLPPDLRTRSALTGVAAVLSVIPRHAQVAVIPIDQVGVRPQQLLKLADACEEQQSKKRPVCFQLASGHIEPFPSLWPQEILDTILAKIVAGEPSVIKNLQATDVLAIPSASHEADIRINMNTTEAAQQYFGQCLQDPFHRKLRYLRLSLTEACNMSCQYCLPKGFEHWMRHRKILDNTQLRHTIEGFRLLGFDKIRFTGGEPTVHPRCLEAVRMARQSGYEKICITTNGALIKSLEPWVEAGIHQFNFSLDSLDPQVFAKITGSDTHGHIMKMIDEALDYGLEVKINAVLLKSVNAKEAPALIDFALARRITLRFIELMPTGTNHRFATDEMVHGGELVPYLQARGLTPRGRDSPETSGPERLWTSSHHVGRIGLINPLSDNFCGACNRLRVTAQGKLRLCLFGKGELDLDMSSPQALADSVRQAIAGKPEKHYLGQANWGNVETFRTIGG